MQDHDLNWRRSIEKEKSIKKLDKKMTYILKFNKESEIVIQNLSKLILDNTQFKLVRTRGSNGGLIGSIIKSKTINTKTEINMRFSTPVSDLAIIDDDKKIIASAGEDNIIYIWDLNKASLIN